jgi:hypothetical protein
MEKSQHFGVGEGRQAHADLVSALEKISGYPVASTNWEHSHWASKLLYYRHEVAEQ